MLLCNIYIYLAKFLSYDAVYCKTRLYNERISHYFIPVYIPDLIAFAATFEIRSRVCHSRQIILIECLVMLQFSCGS